ncbi:DEAD/DEAH box helicase [Sphaerotilus mobilis]|uniref:ATP-dependent Lhr-like helicase n=1 Tax=Sphaerotilus mobilis TaxID=47994 RepID=A0A4Q7LW62_9BURK|nr:DEAD/DEAH box helicase [Sphaerotilus mobilis]RZS57949.1 ATP-dependent Lhr-like helicase [Sphaerotilus mobilis]
MNPFDRLHPALQHHIVNSLGWSTLRPTQLEAIGPILDGAHVLLLAPTAGGKTEAAFLPVLSRMLSEGWRGVSVLYVCPIKALLNNLAPRLQHYAALVGRRVEVWHGDVSPASKRRLLTDPPDVLLTTPESLEGMLISPRIEREAWLGQLRCVIADELHAFAAGDRGWHLRSVIHRIDPYAQAPVQRLGLSATVANPDDLLAWFAPAGTRQTVGSSHVSTDADVTIDHVSTLENAAIVISRLHRGEKRLVFCDSRSSAEKLGAGLRELGVRTFVSHASLSASERRHAEAAFAEERDCVIVATSTLELGIDVGDLDRVIQIDAPATVGSFLQRMGRSGRRTGTRRNCLFLTTSDTALLTAGAICRLWSRAWVEAVTPPASPWNVLVQQSLLMVLERGRMPRHELLDALLFAFPELPAPGIETCLDHLVDATWLACPDDPDLVQIGPKTQAEHERSHYMDLLVTFTGPDLLVGKHGASEVGYLDPAVLMGKPGKPIRLLLGGRRWLARDVDWKRRVVWLEPATEGGKARWMGGGRDMSAAVAHEIRELLVNGDAGAAKLSKRAVAALDDLRDVMPTQTHPPAVEARVPTGFLMWTYAGTARNRKTQLSHRAHGASTADGLSIQWRIDPRLLGDLTPEDPELDDAEVAELATSFKFAEMLPAVARRELVFRRLLGEGGG